MAVEEVVNGVYRLKLGFASAFLILGDEITLIDTGSSGRAPAILDALSELGRAPSDLKHIAITHHHADHSGSLAALLEICDAQVYVHAADAPIIRGERKGPGLNRRTILGKVLGRLGDRFLMPRPAPARVDHELSDGDLVPGAGAMRAVHTPGHTPGHAVFLDSDHGGVLFVGDAAMYWRGKVGPLSGFPTMFNEDIDGARESYRRLAELDFDTACFAHGGVVQGDAAAAFRRGLN
jgi:glyoxylase-like metal-dependent hydrolase (beta-lactamase superfamily II)